jgi:hypothetical protein
VVPTWLHVLSAAYLALGFLCATIISADLLRRPQHMWIMNVVWPVTALFGTVWIMCQYLAYGRLASRCGETRQQHHTGRRSARRATLDGPYSGASAVGAFVRCRAFECGAKSEKSGFRDSAGRAKPGKCGHY